MFLLFCRTTSQKSGLEVIGKELFFKCMWEFFQYCLWFQWSQLFRIYTWILRRWHRNTKQMGQNSRKMRWFCSSTCIYNISASIICGDWKRFCQYRCFEKWEIVNQSHKFSKNLLILKGFIAPELVWSAKPLKLCNESYIFNR